MRSPLITATALAAAAVAMGASDAADAWRARLPDPVVDADYYDNGAPNEAKVELGRQLFFDKILSGNRNIACATCHHPQHATSDGLAMPLGEGPSGLGPERRPGDSVEEAVHERVPRNSTALFNLGAREFVRMFHDGRVETDPEGYYEGGFITPAKWKLPSGLENVLAAQAMFPVTSFAETAGQKSENPVADAVSLNKAAGPEGAWELLAQRLRAIPEYVDRFRQAFPGEVERAEDVTYVRIANAIAAFEAKEFRSDDSPFDRYLRGEVESLGDAADRGMELFYGKAGCIGCHSGKFQTDHDFHAIAMPQIGPGKNDGYDADYWRETGIRAFLEDFGRGRVTKRAEDGYKFRTPSLRNVELTAPYGHAGTYTTLEEVVRHHLDPVEHLDRYRLAEGHMPPLGRVVEIAAERSRLSQDWLTASRESGFHVRDGWVQQHDGLRGKIADANELQPQQLTDGEVSDLLAFLGALTDSAARDLTESIPEEVPSGLPVAD